MEKPEMRYNRKSIGAVSGWLAESRAGCRNEQCHRYKVLRHITQDSMAISILSIWLQAKRSCRQSPSFPNVDLIIYMQHCCICRKSSPILFILRQNDYMIVLLLLGYQKKNYEFCLTSKNHQIADVKLLTTEQSKNICWPQHIIH